MKVAVVCSNGRVGALVVKEALAAGMDVTAFARGENRSEAKKFVQKDVFVLSREDFAGFDAVVDAFGAWTADLLDGIPAAVRKLCDCLRGTKCRLLVVGGAGSLFVDKEHTLCVADGADFPDAFKPLAHAHAQALSCLRAEQEVRWTYLSPAADFQADGARTGKYQFGGEELILSSEGKSEISYADYALAVVEELEKGNHVFERISVVNE